MDWIERFKIALIEEDEEVLSVLAGDLPDFDTPEEAQKAMRLIEEAIALFEKKRKKLSEEMNRLQCSREFLVSSSDAKEERRLDLSS